MRTFLALLILAALANAGMARGEGPIARAEVRGARVHAKDILGSTVPDVDLGPTPPVGAARVIERAEIERAYASASMPPPKNIPSAVRVTRRTRRLGADEVSAAIRTALAERPLPRNAAVSAIRARPAEVGAEYERVTVETPPLPRRAGLATLQSTVTFLGESDAPLFKTIVPIEVVLPPEAAFAEIPRGAPISLIVRRGLVEVTITGVAATDADVGGILPVTIKPSGRVFRARAVDKDHAIALEDS